MRISPPCSTTNRRPLPSPALTAASGESSPSTNGSIVTARAAGSSAPAGVDPAGEAVGWPEPPQLQASAATMATPSARRRGIIGFIVRPGSEAGSRRCYAPKMVRVASPVFVGRAAELAALDHALETAAAGRTTTVLIGGDAGVGKSRLLAAWNDRARERGATVVLGSCLDAGEGGPAYAAIVQALRGLFASIGSAGVEAFVGPDRTALSRILPELRGNRRGWRRRSAVDVGRPKLLFQRLVDIMDRAATDDGPLVLELEDLHWADPSTRRLPPVPSIESPYGTTIAPRHLPQRRDLSAITRWRNASSARSNHRCLPHRARPLRCHRGSRTADCHPRHPAVEGIGRSHL